MEEAQFLSLQIGEMLKTIECERNRHSGFGGPSKASYWFWITEITENFWKKNPYITISLLFFFF